MNKVESREAILHYIRSNREHLNRTYRIQKIALIGSFARDEQTEDSDVDFIITLEDNTENIFELKQDLKRELEQAFGRRVEVASEKFLKPYFRQQIIEEAIYA